MCCSNVQSIFPPGDSRWSFARLTLLYVATPAALTRLASGAFNLLSHTQLAGGGQGTEGRVGITTDEEIAAINRRDATVAEGNRPGAYELSSISG